MPQRQHHQTTPIDGLDESRPEPAPAPTNTVLLSSQQLSRWAKLIAEGRGELPVDLTPPERDRLLTEVRSHLRDRLVHHIARAIAAGVHSELGPRSETDFHAES